MANDDGRCFVYVRYWPGFTDGFPYERFQGLAEDEVLQAVRHALATELRQSCASIRQRRHEAKLRRIKAVMARRAQCISRPDGAHRIPPRPKPRKTRCSRFARLGRYVGWHKGDGYLSLKSGEYLFTPRIWIADLETVEIAAALVQEFTNLHPIDDAEGERNRVFNPRYGLVPCNELSRARQASVLAAIQQLWSKESMTWADLVRPLLPRVNRFLNAWQQLDNSVREADQPAGGTGKISASTVNRTVSSESEIGRPDAAHPLVLENDSAQLAKLRPSQRNAYVSYHLVSMKLGRQIEDRAAHDWIREFGVPNDAGALGELTDYDLPAFDTWARHLRTARKALGDQKYSRRAGRATGRSIAPVDQV